MKHIIGLMLMVIFIASAHSQDIVKAEYFLDNDPGQGNGQMINVITPGGVVNFSTGINVSSLSPGFHFLAMRVLNSAGEWSHFEYRGFYITYPITVNTPLVTAAEFFIDTDPGTGNGTPLTVNSPGNIINENLIVPLPGSISAGIHLLAIRVRDQQGNWSLFDYDSITVGNTPVISCPGNQTVAAPPGTCSAVVSGIDPVNITAGTTYNYTLSGATTGNGSGTASGLTFNAGLTTVTYTTNDAAAASCSFNVTVTTSVLPYVSISTLTTSICAGNLASFTASPVHGGNPSYQWKVNGVNTGSNSNIFSTTGISDGDVVTVAMTSSLSCANPATVVSNQIIMNVSTAVTPSVSIVASATTICTGTNVSFTATPVDGGIPTYQWKLNGADVGVNSNTYQNASLVDGDIVSVVMTSSLGCANPVTVGSNQVVISVAQPIVPAVTITASSQNICSGTNVTFTATPLNGGNNPVYQWKLNGNNVGSNSSTYQNVDLANGDVVYVVMTSSLGCVNPATVGGNQIIMFVTNAVTPSVTITASSTNICSGNTVTFNATPVNGGNPVYQWKVNGMNTGTNSPVFQTSSLANGDAVSVTMTSSLACAMPVSVNSNIINMTITNAVTYYRDLDNDGYGDVSSGIIQSCSPPAGYVAVSGDCNDNNNTVHPGAQEVCSNNVDDNCNGLTDENCNSGLPQLELRTYPVKEGNIGFTLLNARLTLSTPAHSAVQLSYATVNGEAVAGSDFQFAAGTVTIPAGDSSVIISIIVWSDLLREGNENFWLQFSNPVNVVIPGDGKSRVLIVDDDHGKGSANQLLIPTLTRRNQVWTIPGISEYENEILVINLQGEVVNRFINYRNDKPIGNLPTGLYVYHINIRLADNNYKQYKGRFLIIE